MIALVVARAGILPPPMAEIHFARLCDHLRALGVPDVDRFSSHSFRRGTAQEIMRQGRLADVLKAGEWSSSAFLEYQNREEIDEMAVLDLILTKSDDDEPPRVPPAKRAAIVSPACQSKITDFLRTL